ncbi:MAG: peptidoglycan editing factor PgeF [Bacillota bacterium]
MWSIEKRRGLDVAVCGEFNAVPRLIQAFSTRGGGESGGLFQTLNLSFQVGDEAEKVLQNRSAFCGALGIRPELLTCCEQVHGTDVAVVSGSDTGSGAAMRQNSIRGCDAMVTDVPGIPLFTVHADCIPLFLYDPRHKAIGLAHAGRKGTGGGIGGAVLLKMRDAFGSKPEDCLAAIGPGVGACCYDTDEQTAAVFVKWPRGVLDAGESMHGSPHFFLDLALINKLQIVEAGVREENVFIAPWCTSCRPDLFFSYRRDRGATGRMGAVIMISSP